jgi:DNA-directed RNA polymerase specialized sigma54-like protein
MVRTRRRRGGRAQEEVRFVRESSASWLIQTIEQRRRTMIRVMEAIVEAKDFFERGPRR